MATGDGAPAPGIDTDPPPGGDAIGTMKVKDYAAFHAKMEDTLQQRCGQLHRRFRVTGPNLPTPQELFELAVSTSNVIPKAYLCLVERGGKPRIEAVHRPFRYSAHPLETTQWDGEVFVFLGDLMRGNAIVTRRLPPEAFEITNEQTAPNLAAMDPLLQSLNSDHDHIPAPEEGTADTRAVITRNMIQVPHKYVPLVLNKSFTPKQLWIELAGATRDDGKENELSALIDWMSVSCTRASNDEEIDSPETLMGTKLEVFPPLDVDENLQPELE